MRGRSAAWIELCLLLALLPSLCTGFAPTAPLPWRKPTCQDLGRGFRGRGAIASAVMAAGENGAGSFRERAQELLRARREVKYFAFGSNMDEGVLTGVRQVKPLKAEPGIIEGYSLCFNLAAFPFVGPTYAAAEPTGCGGRNEIEDVNGVLFTLTRSDWVKVVATEGVGFAYQIEEVLVKTYAGEEYQALTLRGKEGPTLVPRGTVVLPSRRYLDTLQRGALQNGLSSDYIEKLARIKTYPF